MCLVCSPETKSVFELSSNLFEASVFTNKPEICTERPPGTGSRPSTYVGTCAVVLEHIA